MSRRGATAKRMAEAARAAVQPKSDRQPKSLRMPAFEPTEQQRLFVAAMAGAKMSLREIACLVINPRTNKPIALETLQKAFAYELEAGIAKFKAYLIERWKEKLEPGGQWAPLEFALRAVNGLNDSASALAVTAMDENGERKSSIRVEFVSPSRRYEDDDDDDLGPKANGHD